MGAYAYYLGVTAARSAARAVLIAQYEAEHGTITPDELAQLEKAWLS